MPRGSKPGTKRGGRKRGTPNRRTILADRIFVAAAAHPVAGWQELLSVLMDDQALPADTRLVIAQKSRSAAARSNKARAKTTNAKSAATSSQKQVAVELNSLFRLARNASLTEEERRKAAARMARVLLPATPTGDPSWSRAVADEYGFVISPKIASEYRDAKLLLRKLEDGKGSIRPGNVRQADKARARLAAIRRSLEPPPPRSTEFINVTGSTSLLPRTNFCRIKSACLSSRINADPKLALPRKKSPRRPTAWLGSTRSYTERRARQEPGWLTSKGK